MSRPRSRPPPEEDIESDGKVNQCDEPQALVLAAVRGLKQHGCVDGNARTNQEIVDVPPSAYGKPLMGQERYARRGHLIGRNQQIPSLDPGPLAGAIFQHPLGLEAAWRL